ncbi:MAG: tRNA 2-thiouridine(34) synthase MnmA [Candidatus Dojkabacteria bacterium]
MRAWSLSKDLFKNSMNQIKGKKVFVGLSGGVDSAVSAYLLKKQGYDVTGVYMKNWSGDEFGIQADCPWEEDQKDAEAVCKHIGIPFRSMNFEKQYRDKVVEYFFNEYEKGRTPNPDVMCNKEIKFKLFLEKAISEGADFIATGHYAQKIMSYQSSDLRGSQGPFMLKGKDSNKDQTYFLYNLTHDQLDKVLFPIGHLQKPEVRKIAEEAELPNAKKPDSQGICFIGEINVLQFLMSKIPVKEGEIRDIDTNKVVGKHKGVYFYTIGQRDGLGIGGTVVPYFVCKKDIEKNIVYVCLGSDHKALYSQEVELENLHLINPELRDQISEIKLEASVRYRQKPVAGKLIRKSLLEEGGPACLPSGMKNREVFIFDEPVRAVASGQSLVIYSGEVCLGGGVIK